VIPIPLRIRRLLQALGIDRAVGYILLGYGWNFLAQPITLFMIVTFLTRREQDFYYTFGSIIGIQAFFELGLVAAVQQFASHEAGHLHWTNHRTLSGDPGAKSRMASLFRQAVAWYVVIAVVLGVVLLPAGWLILSKGGNEIDWRFPWTWAALVAAVIILPMPAMVILNGSGRIAESLRAMAIQRIVINGTQWAVLAVGGGLLSWAASQTAGLIFLAGWLFLFWRPAFRDLWRHPPGGPRVNWRREVWPFQWKVALSTPFIYLTFQVFTPVLFLYAAEGESGRMGLCLTIANALTGASSAWVISRMPLFGHIIARREWAALDRMFWRSFRQSAMMLAVAAAAVWTVIVILQGATGNWIGDRLLRVGLILLGAFVQHAGFSMACYLRAHRRDPFSKLFIALGATTAAVAFTVGRAGGGTLSMSAIYLVMNVVFYVGWGVAIFARSRRAWHEEPPADPNLTDLTARDLPLPSAT
jgi:hypothetical protein